jgi:tRNA(Ile)-lysidine synthase
MRRTIRRYALVPPDGRVLVAVSGGSDSVALAHLLHRLEATEPFEVVGVVHLHHGFRGAAADDDAEAVKSLAGDLKLRCHLERVDIRARASERGQSIEEAGRAARLEFFERVAGDTGADRVAVGHTADDQAETFLLRILRGAGTRGLSAVYPRHGVVIRPLLDLSRHALREFLLAERITFRDDETNDDLSIPRNRIRHELLPLLRDRFAPGIDAVLAREARLAREDADWLEEAANQAGASLVEVQEGVIVLDPVELLALPPALVSRVVRRALGTLAPGRFIGLDHVEAVIELAQGDRTAVSLPGQHAERAGDSIRLTSTDAAAASSTSTLSPMQTEFSYEFSVPGEIVVPEAGRRLTAEVAEVPDRSSLTSGGDEVVLDAGDLAGPLRVRGRRAGDRFQPLGAPGRRSVQDLFVDRKIARGDRDAVPIVTDSAGRIVWVVGVTIAHQFRVTERTRSVVVLKAR